MFYYFAYGANMNATALKNRGVAPLKSEPARLKQWSLTFNLKSFFDNEGQWGNIEPSTDPNAAVHGILHYCDDKDIVTLDNWEGIGYTYDRIMTQVTTYRGQEVDAYIYVGLPTCTLNTGRPSKRYLNIILAGAIAANLDKAYLEHLNRIETHSYDAYGLFEYPRTPDTLFTSSLLAKYPHYTALAGAVFNIAGINEADFNFFKSTVGGQDITVWLLQRMDSSDGNECIEDFKHNRLTNAQRHFLNEYLHEFNDKFEYVGQFVYDESKGSE